MIRFAFFVDGSNLFGTLKDVGVEVDDYQAFFAHLYKAAEQQWCVSVGACPGTITLLQRIYWYQVGSIDWWDLDDAQAQAYLHGKFKENKQISKQYMALVGKEMSAKSQTDLTLKAWSFFSRTDALDIKGGRRFWMG